MTQAGDNKAAWLVGGGEMGSRTRSFDWSQTSLGAIEAWPQSLKSLVKTLLTSRYPMVLTWGPEFAQFYNDAYSELIGDKHPAALGTDIRETMAEAWDTLGPMIQRVMATGVANWTPALLLVLLRARYREESYFSVSHAPAEDDFGQIVGMLAVCSEVTQQVLGERRLRLLRDLASKAGETQSVEATCQDLMAAIAASPLDVPFALLYLREPNGTTLILQAAVGLSAEELGRPRSVDLAISDDVWSLDRSATGETVLVEAIDRRITVPGGPWHEPVRSALAMPIASEGQTPPLGVLVAGISPNRALDEGYRSFYELLVGQVSVSIRNARAYEEERRRAEMLAEIDRAKTVFFSNVSHELRTPLTLILNPLADVLQSGSLPPFEREQVSLAHRNSLRLLKLVNTLLDFSRIEAGRQKANYEPTDLATYTAQLASLFRSAVEQAGLQLAVDCPPLPEPIYVDRGMWEKIVLNLLSNAFKFTFEGEIAVALHSVGNEVELSVRDTGTGIPAAELPKLFERFHRVEGARGRTFEGTGIGLSLVQELVHLLFGTIAVESTLGKGSTFRVRLPVGTAPRANRPIESEALTSGKSYVEEALGWLPSENSEDSEALSLPKKTAAQFSASARILLVDDNADMRNYLSGILSQFYEVERVADGETALVAARARTPDLVLSDVMMPGMDGFELLRQLRLDPQTREIPILLLSARAGEESAVEGLEAGANDYLVKPFSTRELLARVAANLEQGRSRANAARRRIDAVVSSVSDFIYTLDLAGRFTYVNQALLDLWQKTYAEAIGKNFFELDYPPELAARLQQQIQQVIRERQPLKDEMTYTSASGTRAYEYIFVPLFDAGGAVEAVAGTSRDITDRKLAEAALRASEEQSRNILESIDDGFFALDENWRFTYVNRSAEILLDRTPRDLIGKNFWEEFPGLNGSEFERVHRRAASERVALSVTAFYSDHNRWYDVRSYPAASGITIYFRNVTDRVQLESDREQLLQQTQAAREEAERANRIKDEFLAVLSHELRSPLNPILGWTRLLQNGKLDTARQAEALATIERNAKLQSQLIEDLLDISRIMQGKLTLTPAPVSLTFVISCALETVRLAAEAKNIPIALDLDLRVAPVSGDAARLQQVVWNLLANAVKFTPNGSPITVELRQVERQAQIRVMDTGSGINPQFLPHVFEYFRQEDGSTTRKFGGLGLGLAIVRQIVELHGGTVEAESPGEGLGATFTVKLPLMPVPSAAAVDRPSSEPSLDLHGVRVLAIDDEIDSREFVAFVLEQAGAFVTTATTAREGFAAFLECQPDVLLSDIGMPDMNGYMLMRQIRALPPSLGGQIPAIALTAYAGDFNQQQALKAGFQRHLAKPIEPDELIGAIASVLGKNCSFS
ncbi:MULTISPECIES: ATP-binding protein [unclassified Microcoleus]|uniref:ATP-binding protein n=1 Tax=unclassified Microcoleus TaxID=2642155 RepID=UPI002FD05BA0